MTDVVADTSRLFGRVMEAFGEDGTDADMQQRIALTRIYLGGSDPYARRLPSVESSPHISVPEFTTDIAPGMPTGPSDAAPGNGRPFNGGNGKRRR